MQNALRTAKLNRFVEGRENMTGVPQTIGGSLCQRAEAYVDEAGAKGLLRKLGGSSDDKIALIAAIVVPLEDRDRFRTPFEAPLERFKAARPPKVGSLHITDAFGSGSREWAEAAEDARKEIFENIRALEIPIVYDACRLRIYRETYQRMQKLVADGSRQRRSNVITSHRASSERVEEECMIGLLLKLDALASHFGIGLVDLMTDQLDKAIAKIFNKMMARARTAGDPKERPISSWDRDAGKRLHGSIRTSITDMCGKPLDWLSAKRLGDFVVLGKDDALVFAADVVVNALHHHLDSLPPDAPLNHPSSVGTWLLSDRVYGVRDDAIEDKI